MPGCFGCWRFWSIILYCHLPAKTYKSTTKAFLKGVIFFLWILPSTWQGLCLLVCSSTAFWSIQLVSWNVIIASSAYLYWFAPGGEDAAWYHNFIRWLLSWFRDLTPVCINHLCSSVDVIACSVPAVPKFTLALLCPSTGLWCLDEMASLTLSYFICLSFITVNIYLVFKLLTVMISFFSTTPFLWSQICLERMGRMNFFKYGLHSYRENKLFAPQGNERNFTTFFLL